MAHKITFEDVKGFHNVVDLAGSFGKSSNKRLQAILNLNEDGTLAYTFQVQNNKDVCTSTDNLYRAVEVYNSLP